MSYFFESRITISMPVAWPKWLEDAKLVGEDLGVYARDSSADSGTKGELEHPHDR